MSASLPDTYDAFAAHMRQLTALSQAAGVLSWDQEVMMPPKGAAGRAEQMAALSTVMHEKITDPRMGDWLDALEDGSADFSSVEAANIRLARKKYARASKVPGRLATELARTTSMAQTVWAKARAAKDYAAFAPTLKNIIDLKREEAGYIAADGQSAYDALLADFEPGMTVAVLRPLLEGLRPRLSALRERIAEKAHTQPKLSGTFSADAQMKLARELADVLNYDWQEGRLDLSVHPFSSGTRGDSRITTRVDDHDPMGCLYSTVHELGHALYEVGLPEEHQFMPAGQHVSMGVHESQSRLWENQIGRCAAFCRWLAPRFAKAFDRPELAQGDTLYRVINRVETGFIRTEADEVHYNLHVLLRFELEEDLMAGNLSVDDLEGEWASRFERDFGTAVPDASLGVLQDVHWSVGLFGYFPTYALGNIYAAQLYQKLETDLGTLDDRLEKGETGDILAWLRKNVHEKGSLLPADELMEQASGQPVSGEPLLDYLEEKYSALLDL
ncbi:MAG: carboxypeptidase M32 [Pseudomonadota bacterium]